MVHHLEVLPPAEKLRTLEVSIGTKHCLFIASIIVMSYIDNEVVYIFMTKKISAGQVCPLLAHCIKIVIACCWIKKLVRNEAITCNGVFSFHHILSDGINSAALN